MADIQIEDLSATPLEATDKALVRRGAGPGDHTMALVDLGGAGVLDVGTSAGTVAAGDHTHAAAIAAGASGFMTGADKTKLDGIASGAQVNVATDLTYTAATRVLASSTGTDATLPLVSSGDAGLAPASGGGTSNFLRADGTWAAPAGGGGSPGGSSGEVQYNNGGAFAGAADVEIEGGQLRLPAISPPTAPAAGGVKLFGKGLAGRTLPAFDAEIGEPSALMPHIAYGRWGIWAAGGNNTTDTAVGIATNSTGTSTGVNWATTNYRTRLRWREYLVTVAATTAVAGQRGAAAQFSLGASVSSQNVGGFHFVLTWSPATGVVSTHRAFAGMTSSNAAPTDVNPSTLLNMIGMGYDSADTNIQFMNNDGSGTATKTDLGASFPKPSADRTSAYRIEMYAPPGATQVVHYLITNLTSGATASGSVTTDIPANTTALCYQLYTSVAGVSSVIGVAVGQLFIGTEGPV